MANSNMQATDAVAQDTVSASGEFDAQLQKIQQEIMKKTGATFASEVVQRRGLGCTDE